MRRSKEKIENVPDKDATEKNLYGRRIMTPMKLIMQGDKHI
jgi:hypothetical protein